MKKIILLSTCLALSAICFGQKKDTALAKVNTDTLVIDLAKTKVIKINGRLFSSQLLAKPGIYVVSENFTEVLAYIQEQPARFANPFTAWFKQYFGLQ